MLREAWAGRDQRQAVASEELYLDIVRYCHQVGRPAWLRCAALRRVCVHPSCCPGPALSECISELACAHVNTFAVDAPWPVVVSLTSYLGLQMELTLIALTSRPLPLALTRQHLAGELAGRVLSRHHSC